MILEFYHRLDWICHTPPVRQMHGVLAINYMRLYWQKNEVSTQARAKPCIWGVVPYVHLSLLSISDLVTA